MTTATTVLAQHAAKRSRDWPEDALHGAKRAYADTIACIIAGRADEAVERANAAVRTWSPTGPSWVITSSAGAAPPIAAFLNGTAAHALDYDDVLEPAAAHASAVLVPALLAVGQARRSTSAELLDALLIGFDVLGALGMCMNMAHYAKGWHTTVTLGSIAAAAACGRLVGLDTQRMRAAISAATSFSSASKRQFGTNMKPVHAGLAAQAGVFASSLAEQGVTAAEEVLEGEWSFSTLFGDAGIPGFADLKEFLSGPPTMQRYGAWIKAYPCCASAHRPIDALISLRRAQRFSAQDIVAIDAHVSDVVMRNLMYARPTTDMEARFSLNHCLSLAARADAISIADFRVETLRRPEHLAFWPKVAMHLNPALGSKMSAEPGTERAKLIVKLSDGRTLEELVVFPKGHPKAPLKDQELAEKFADCTRGYGRPEVMAQLSQALLGPGPLMTEPWTYLQNCDAKMMAG